jgi:hypothetical protein
MFGNIDDPLESRPGGKWLELCGPLIWDEQDPTQGPEPADRVTVAANVTQTLNGNTVTAQGFATFNKRNDEWMINVNSGPNARFDDGPADVEAFATVTDPLPLRQVPPWSAAVQLKQR